MCTKWGVNRDQRQSDEWEGLFRGVFLDTSRQGSLFEFMCDAFEWTVGAFFIVVACRKGITGRRRPCTCHAKHSESGWFNWKSTWNAAHTHSQWQVAFRILFSPPNRWRSHKNHQHRKCAHPSQGRWRHFRWILYTNVCGGVCVCVCLMCDEGIKFKENPSNSVEIERKPWLTYQLPLNVARLDLSAAPHSQTYFLVNTPNTQTHYVHR